MNNNKYKTGKIAKIDDMDLNLVGACNKQSKKTLRNWEMFNICIPLLYKLAAFLFKNINALTGSFVRR